MASANPLPKEAVSEMPTPFSWTRSCGLEKCCQRDRGDDRPPIHCKSLLCYQALLRSPATRAQRYSGWVVEGGRMPSMAWSFPLALEAIRGDLTVGWEAWAFIT